MHRTSIVGILQLQHAFLSPTTSTCCGNGPAHQPTPPLSLFMQSRESQQHACPTDFGPATVAFLDRQMRLQQPGHRAQPSGNERAGPAAPPQRNPSTRPSVWRLPHRCNHSSNSLMACPTAQSTSLLADRDSRWSWTAFAIAIP